MDLAEVLDACRVLEIRAAALYRRFAAWASDEPDLCALWMALAGEEEEHVVFLDDASRHLPTLEAWTTHLGSRWHEVLRDADEKLSAAELISNEAPTDQQLAVALALELTEIEALHAMLVATSRHRPPRPSLESHARRLADMVERFSVDPQVRRQAALLLARVRPAVRDSDA